MDESRTKMAIVSLNTAVVIEKGNKDYSNDLDDIHDEKA